MQGPIADRRTEWPKDSRDPLRIVGTEWPKDVRDQLRNVGTEWTKDSRDRLWIVGTEQPKDSRDRLRSQERREREKIIFMRFLKDGDRSYHHSPEGTIPRKMAEYCGDITAITLRHNKQVQTNYNYSLQIFLPPTFFEIQKASICDYKFLKTVMC